MATVTAFIRTSKTDKNKSANVRFRLRDGRDFQLFHKSKISVVPDKWDEKQQKIKSRCLINENERIEFDKAVNERKALINEIYKEKGSTLNSDLLDVEIDKALHPEKYEVTPEITTLFQFIEKFIAEAPNRKGKRTKRLVSMSTIKQYKVAEKHLKEFAQSQRKQDYTFDEINKTFYDKYVDFLQRKSYTNNYVGSQIRKLKLILNDVMSQIDIATATLLGITMKDFTTLTEEIDTIYLNETELQQLKNTDLSKIPHLDRVRDWFLLLAWTGCRFSDLSKITKTDIKDGFISFRQQKTNTKVTIPLHPIVLEILEKYKYDLPEEISNQKFNDYIKEVCRIAEINGTETTTRTVGGKLETESFEKWEQVSSHTGRRSFCTNMYKRGLPTLMIMSISGHKTEKSFLKYIKVKQDEHAEMLKKAWAEMYK